MLTERQKIILKTVVEEYVRTVEPVGSKMICDNPDLQYSSATIRNEMVILENLGYLNKTYTSSGRIPSEKGYKKYVELTMEGERNQNFDFPIFDNIFSKYAYSQEKAIEETMSMVSDLTNYAVVALGNSAAEARIEKIQLVSLDKDSAVIILVTDDGHVQSKKIFIPDGVNLLDIQKVIVTLNEVLHKSLVSEIDERLQEALNNKEIENMVEYYGELIGVFARAVASMVDDKYFVTGQSNIINQPEFQDIDKIKGILKALGEKDLLKVVKVNQNGLSIQIGSDINMTAMKDCTVVSIPYMDKEGMRGTLAVIGPKRMEYKKVIPMLEYIAKNMNNF